MGPAIPAFFEFAWFAIYAMIISLLVYSIYNLWVFAKDNWCGYDPAPGEQHQKYCGSAWKFYFSQANKTEFEIDYVERILYMVNWCLLLALKLYFVRVMLRLDMHLDEKMIEITDYTVEIRDLPVKLTAMDLIHFFDGKAVYSAELNQTLSVKPVAVNYVFSDTELLTKQDEAVKRSLKQYGQFKVKGDLAGQDDQKSKFYERVGDLERSLELRYTMPFAEFDNMTHPAINFSGKAFLSFNSMIDCNAVIDQLAISGLPRVFYKYLGAIPKFFSYLEMGNHQKSEEGLKFYVLPARNPADVLWENQGLSALDHTIRGLASFFLTCLIIGASFGAAIGLKQWQGSVKSNWMASIVLTLVIKIFNAIFGEVTKYMIKFERPETRTMFHVLTFWRMSLVSSTDQVFFRELYYPLDRFE